MPTPRNRLKWNATCKVYPAIGDLQAVEAQIDYLFDGAAGATGAITKDTGAVPAGKLWILNFATMWVDGNACTLHQMMLRTAADQHKLLITGTPASQVQTIFNGFIVMKPTEYVRFTFSGIVAGADTLVCTMRAYQVSQY